jgi:hypothetical protein
LLPKSIALAKNWPRTATLTSRHFSRECANVRRRYADQQRRLRAVSGQRTVSTQAYAERSGQLDPQSLAQSVGVLIGKKTKVSGTVSRENDP